ncbi:hypothetical protein AXX17_AT1G65580 [Arabidopsis thaliana]|uniref:Uncharacterized protein n=1 Tax=Arabidopsis thaliana TaxID=3702 RepID=A0A178WDT3_ARATH|nr:hypothetical protein AXX17_AT1G65580 [Arabidopsis thaliana]
MELHIGERGGGEFNFKPIDRRRSTPKFRRRRRLYKSLVPRGCNRLSDLDTHRFDSDLLRLLR